MDAIIYTTSTGSAERLGTCKIIDKREGEKVMSEKNIIIRLETKDDYRAAENLTREAFWNVYRPGCMEHYVLHCYRNDPAFVPELDFLMELDGELIGQTFQYTTSRGLDMSYSKICFEGDTTEYFWRER